MDKQVTVNRRGILHHKLMIQFNCLTSNFILKNFILQQSHMAANKPRSDLVGWRMDEKPFQLLAFWQRSKYKTSFYINSTCLYIGHNMTLLSGG